MKKLEIYMVGGFVIPVEDTFEEIMTLLDGKAIRPEDYFVSHLQDGGRTAFRKQDVVGIAEYEEEA